MDDLWNVDQQALTAIVKQLEIDGLDFADTEAACTELGLDENAGFRVLRRLVDGGMLEGRSPFGGTWVIGRATAQGLRDAKACQIAQINSLPC